LSDFPNCALFPVFEIFIFCFFVLLLFSNYFVPYSLFSLEGGIVDGRGVASALTLGADGVMMGTRFLASTESIASHELKQKLVKAQGTDVCRRMHRIERRN
jgi:hypothetical protein